MDYYAYVIRIWRENAMNPWQITLDDPGAAQRRQFDSLEALYEFIQETVLQDERPSQLKEER